MSDECRGKNTSSRHPFDADLFANAHFVRRLLATTSNLVYIYDLVGRCNVYANQDMLELLGYRKEQIGRFHSQLMATIIYAEDGEKVVQHHARFSSALDSDVFTLEYRVKAANGELRLTFSP